MPTYHLLIKGEVQGVFFRATSKEMANKFGVKGWIKNTEDDNVEATITGDEKAVQQFIEWSKKGPKKAVVEDVIVTKSEEKMFDSFTVIR
ncbi:MAG: acylphosphatase [Chitinophagaceae bacterium]